MGRDKSHDNLDLSEVYSEIEKLEGELFFLRENFPFPRSDSCLAEQSEGRQSRSRKRKALEEKKGG